MRQRGVVGRPCCRKIQRIAHTHHYEVSIGRHAQRVRLLLSASAEVGRRNDPCARWIKQHQGDVYAAAAKVGLNAV